VVEVGGDQECRGVGVGLEELEDRLLQARRLMWEACTKTEIQWVLGVVKRLELELTRAGGDPKADRTWPETD